MGAATNGANVEVCIMRRPHNTMHFVQRFQKNIYNTVSGTNPSKM